MKRFATITAAICLSALPALADDAADDNGFSLMEEGAKLFFEGIMREMEPALDDLRGLADEMEPALREFVQEMGPAFADLMGKIDDLNAYHPPEILPNGDIILRKKTPQELSQEPDSEIEI
ncbi:hypothetical protein PEL8287_03544 [Roseovarius litorisediminis]|uniref:AAA+ family ATPase n=1 Tax=Roseovarius litorisediminis TaxID=1312363 RepID=A0A1Y5THY8_9RHOB|nr:hypothetical protein [Roseovarius litorisediminis]SLN64386.1 hypothetical protein PEL8287_03544 [Roseovarius litorisediminis]